MIDVVNLQRKIKIEVAAFRTFSLVIISEVSEAAGRQFSIAFISDSRMKQLNEMFRGQNSTTDVLSFPYEHEEFLSEPGAVATGSNDGGQKNPVTTVPGSDFLGDIVISVETAQKQGAENGLTLEGEIKQLILHGLLHLCGYDHETDDGEMNSRELELRELLKI